MGRAKKVVLAYSGGVDTSVCIPYLKQEWGVDTWKGGFVCTGPKPSPPDEWLEDVLD